MRKTATLVSLCGVLALATACASNSASAGDPGTSTAASAAQSGPALHGSYTLMTFGPFSAAGSEGATTYDEIRVGALAAAKQINAAGGVNGKAITIQVCDTKGDPNLAVSCAEQAVKEKLPAVVGSYDTGGDYLAPLQTAGIPAIGQVGLGAEYTSPVAFPVYNGLEVYLGMFSLLAKKGIKDVAFVFQDFPGVQSKLQPIINAGQKLGLNITSIPVEANQADYTPVVARAQSHKSIIVGLTDTQAIPFVTALRQAGYPGTIAGSMSAQAITQLGSAADGIYSVNAYLPASDTANSDVVQWVNAMNAIDPQALKGDASANAYLSVELFAKAAQGMSTVSGPALVHRLETMGPIATGLRPPVSFGSVPPSVQASFPTLPRLFDVNVVFEQVSGGVLKALSGTFSNAITGAPVKS